MAFLLFWTRLSRARLRLCSWAAAVLYWLRKQFASSHNSLTGHPTATLPSGLSGDALPIGLQVGGWCGGSVDLPEADVLMSAVPLDAPCC